MQLAITGILVGLVVAGGAVGATYAFERMGSDDCYEASASSGGGAQAGSTGDCNPWVPVDCDPEAPNVAVPEDAEGLVRFRVDNTGRATEGVFCLMQEGDVQRAGIEHKLPAREVTIIDLKVPAGTYRAMASLDDGTAKASVGVDLRDCPDRAYQVDVTTNFGFMGGNSVATKSGSCIEQAGSPQQAAVPGSLPEGPGGDGASPGAAAVAVGVAGLAAIALVVYRWPTIKYAFVGLFTRLVKPKILDHDVRAQIHELVQSDPGIHASAVARRLELAGGQSRYHLSVLCREGLLTLVRMDGTRHYFPTGTFPPDRMRAIAALRSPSTRRIYETIRAVPGRSVKSTAEAAAVAPSTVLRVADRLVRAGLIRRRRDGRTVRLDPTDAW